MRPPIEYIYSAVDFNRMHPLTPEQRFAVRRGLGIRDETFAVGFIAAFNEKKNQLGYLRGAVSPMRESCPAAQTFFVGDFEPETNAYAGECLEAARAEGLDEFVRFVGFCSEVEKWYQACDVIVVPTRKEGMARCMIEALACGTPVVSFDVCSAVEILEEHRCGRVAAQGDYQQLTGAIVNFAQSAQMRSDYGSTGSALARRLFSPEASLEKYRNLILSLEGANLGTRHA